MYGLCYLTSSTLDFVKPYSQATLNFCNNRLNLGPPLKKFELLLKIVFVVVICPKISVVLVFQCNFISISLLLYPSSFMCTLYFFYSFLISVPNF